MLVAAAAAGDFWLHRTKSGLRLKAVGFREQAAKRNGVRTNFVHLRAYILSALLATVAGFFLSSEVGVGHPSIGSTYTLPSIAAAVLGGAALTGGRGSFLGTLFGSLFFTLTVNVISLLGLQHRRRHHRQRCADPVCRVHLFRTEARGSCWSAVSWMRCAGNLPPRRECDSVDEGCNRDDGRRDGGARERQRADCRGQGQAGDRPSHPDALRRHLDRAGRAAGVGGIVVPRSLLPQNMLAVMPLAAFLAIAAMGQSLVLMTRGIDLSIPAVVTLSSTLLLGVSGGSDSGLVGAIVVALLAATAIGLINGMLVGLLQLNALIVTLAVGAILSGVTLWYRQGLPAESGVPPMLADWGGTRLARRQRLGLGSGDPGRRAHHHPAQDDGRPALLGGRRQSARRPCRRHQPADLPDRRLRVAGLLYGMAGILLSAFIRNPTLDVGNAYLLAPIAAAVLGGTAMSGGIGSMIAVAGAALFLTHLGQMLKMMGIATAFQLIVQGIAIALGMGLSQLNVSAPVAMWNRLVRRA